MEYYIIDENSYGFFDGQHNEPTEMTVEEIKDFINFLTNIINNREE